jgi:hypothetical protein
MEKNEAVVVEEGWEGSEIWQDCRDEEIGE